MKPTIAVLIAVILGGCDKKGSGSDPSYQGVAMSKWIQMVDDRDGHTQAAALDALANFKDQPAALEAVKKHTNDPTPGVRLAACLALYRLNGDKKPAIAYLEKQCRNSDKESEDYLLAPITLRDMAGTFGKDGLKELEPYLKQLESRNDDADSLSLDTARLSMGMPVKEHAGFNGLPTSRTTTKPSVPHNLFGDPAK